MASGKGFSLFGPRCGYVFQAVLQVVCRERGADFTGKFAFFFRPVRRAVMLQCAVHGPFERTVRQIAGAGFIKATLDSGFGHHRRALGDFLDARVDLLRIGHLRSADQVQHFCLSLHHVRRNSAGIGDGVMNARFFNDVFVEEVCAGGHQRHGIQRATSQMWGVCGVGGDPLKPPGGLNIGQRADVKHSGKGFRMPGHGSVHVVK